MRLLKRVGLGILFLIIVTVGIAFGYDRYASRDVAAMYPPDGDILTVDGVDVHTLCRGAGDETLILFHGFAGGAIDMLPLMEALQSDLRVCSFDRPGNDYSAPLPDDWTIDDALAWHNKVILALGAGTPTIAGHSLGGAYALAYAARYPTQGVILLDGLSPEVADAVVGRMGAYSSLTMPAQMGLLRPIAGTFVSGDYADYDANLLVQMQALRSRSQTIVAFAEEGSLVADGLTTSALSDAVDMLDVPLLILASAETDVPEGQAFYESLRALHDTYPQSTLITIPDARHYVIVTHADLLNEHVLDWMDAQ
jgi:pimeloyl-ACP methyl ester carboxylesterase